jgi:Ni,Fe-hydrogenase I large subunit
VVEEGFSADLWSAVITQYVKALRIRRLIFEASALFIGRAPMTSNLVAGGVTVDYDDDQFEAKCETFKKIMKTRSASVHRQGVRPGRARTERALSGLRQHQQRRSGWGAGLGNFLAWGNYPLPGGGIGVKGGKVDNLGTPDVFMSGYGDLTTAIGRVEAGLREYITYSRYKDDSATSTREKPPIRAM